MALRGCCRRQRPCKECRTRGQLLCNRTVARLATCVMAAAIPWAVSARLGRCSERPLFLRGSLPRILASRHPCCAMDLFGKNVGGFWVLRVRRCSALAEPMHRGSAAQTSNSILRFLAPGLVWSALSRNCIASWAFLTAICRSHEVSCLLNLITDYGVLNRQQLRNHQRKPDQVREDLLCTGMCGRGC